MLKHLRRRLTILFSILTAAVLAAALTATCRMAQIEAVSGADLVFANTVSAIEDAVTENNLVRDSWLASQEAAGRLVLYMEDNGHPLVFSGGWTPADARTTLVALAREQAVSAGLNPDRLHRQKVNFSLNGAQLSGSYTCTAMLLPSEQMSSAVLLYIIRDMGPLHDRLWAMVWQYTALWAAGALILAFLSHWMVDRALRPTAQAMQKQREFVAAAGHELRSPLTVLKASLQAAQAPETAHLAPQFLSHAASEVDRLSRLTEDLLILAGGDAGVLRTSLAQINTDTFLVELYERFVPVARDHGHSLTLHLPDNPLPALHADAQRLEQLFAVLLNNAFEYSPAGTPVEILAELPPSGGLHIAVVDHGPGSPTQKNTVSLIGLPEETAVGPTKRISALAWPLPVKLPPCTERSCVYGTRPEAEPPSWWSGVIIMFWTDPAFRKYRMLSETAKALQREISRCKALSISYS